MISVTYLFEEEELLTEGKILNVLKKFVGMNYPELEDILKDKDVQKFVEISRKITEGKKMNPRYLSEFERLMKKKNVHRYMEQIQFSGPRAARHIMSGVAGGFLGAEIGAGVAIGASLPIAAVAVVGAIAGGMLSAKYLPKIVGILGKWRTQGELRRATTGTKPVSVSI